MWLPIVGGKVGEVDGEMDGVAEGSAGMGSAAVGCHQRLQRRSMGVGRDPRLTCWSWARLRAGSWARSALGVLAIADVAPHRGRQGGRGRRRDGWGSGWEHGDGMEARARGRDAGKTARAGAKCREGRRERGTVRFGERSRCTLKV
jgi:hypothetical protein